MHSDNAIAFWILVGCVVLVFIIADILHRIDPLFPPRHAE